ncbi:discoidin, CUB and LCCL domain-containing protein 1 isoform X1 [Alosa sapidissima]|uniref:discoidin, CUB and LCCL domain-containing protein 1 isoform X1 n=1 Tax=Alosa sapidissima TaxID=34773 RepID=UPI001C0885A7|nr:discoidin, CUB and LCCL domain-containing protein 1 isoform X1 [Alosa sapidissima]
MYGNGKLYGIILIYSSLSRIVCGEKSDNACGHTIQGPDSGILSSQNYPGTYPNNSLCEWRISVPKGNSITIKFADLSIESRDCDSDYVRILQGSGRAEQVPALVLGPFCGDLKSAPSLLKSLHVEASEIRVQFRSGQHISGRGFLLSYATGNRKDLLTCLDKGNHFSDAKYSKYCPAGCRAVDGDVSGDISQGYRHTSVLCKAAVHAGVISNELGGDIVVEEQSGRSHYPAVWANGILSQDGSLSEKLFTFVTNDCKKRQVVLQPVALNASSGQRSGGVGDGPPAHWSPNDTDPAASSALWTPDSSHTGQPWLQLDLGEKRRITGILTAGSPSADHYVRSYKVEYRERNRWKAYTQNNSSEPTVLEGNVDSHQQTRSTLQPSIVARHLRLLPQAWNQRVAMRVELLGCPYVKSPPAVTVIVLENTVNSSSQVTLETLDTKPKPAGEEDRNTEHQPIDTSPLIDLVRLVIIIVAVAVLVLMLPVCVCVYKALHKRKSKESGYGSSEAQHTGCWKQIKQPFARHQSTEFTISYSSEKEPIQKLDLVTSAMAAEYQQPLMIGTGTVSRKGSTFRPMDTDAKEDGSDGPSHYDFLKTANQYALPLTNQEPEYATPIIERHAFRKEAFVPDPSYSVPGAVLSNTPSFKATENGVCRNKGGAAHVGGYQTPQAKVDRPNHSEGVYDSPKVRRPAPLCAAAISNYQRPQAKASVLECYSTPRDCVRLGPPSPHRPDPEGSSDPPTQSGT